MVDPVVAYDKLSNFQTGQEIREYFQDCGIKANKRSNTSCAIARWFIETTGESIVSVSQSIKVGNKPIKELDLVTGFYPSRNYVPLHDFMHTKATLDFIEMFDDGECPELVAGWDEYDE